MATFPVPLLDRRWDAEVSALFSLQMTPLRGTHWSPEEVEAIVADYFSMLKKELLGEPYSKSSHRRRLAAIVRRSDGSIERKHQNISAILIEAGHPYIRGYKPLSQYQWLLSDVVHDRLGDDEELRVLAEHFVSASAPAPSVPDLLSVMHDPPSLLESVKIALAVQRARRQARHTDYLQREAQNRSIGLGGESFVVSFEKARLSSRGCDVLAERVEHVSVTRGDGLGYDVLSFTEDAREKHIEVKTTKLGPLTPFYLTASELTFSRENRHSYSLYRVHDFVASPAMFALNGPVDATCSLEAAQYIAVPR